MNIFQNNRKEGSIKGFTKETREASGVTAPAALAPYIPSLQELYTLSVFLYRTGPVQVVRHFLLTVETANNLLRSYASHAGSRDTRQGRETCSQHVSPCPGPVHRAQAGFTLIEILVVIAIIGILASVVLASLNRARDKGSDAAIKSSLDGARAQAELYYDSNGGVYTDVCTTGTENLVTLLEGARTAGSATVNCADATAAWAVEAQLKSTTDFYCVDSTGNASTTSTSTISDGSDYDCG